MKKQIFALLVASFLLAPAAHAVVILGTGTGSLVGGDLTDPENNGLADSNVNYDAVFRSSVEPFFGGGEGAFNVFDNRLGGGNDKWCCSGPGAGSVWVEADFGIAQYVLTSFTASSANDVPGRDADQWQIKGSNDGINYTTIFDYNNNGTSPWASRFQVNQYTAGIDYGLPTAFSIFRYEATSVVSGSNHQIGELEFFGEPATVPEPATLALMGLGLAGIGFRRKRKAA